PRLAETHAPNQLQLLGVHRREAPEHAVGPIRQRDQRQPGQLAVSGRAALVAAAHPGLAPAPSGTALRTVAAAPGTQVFQAVAKDQDAGAPSARVSAAQGGRAVGSDCAGTDPSRRQSPRGRGGELLEELPDEGRGGT
ncbi:unnamed protein product, partial [Ectocarpus sp. 13 AM-2016]